MSEYDDPNPTRRTVLQKAAAIGGVAGLSGIAATGTAAAGVGRGRVAHYPLNNIRPNGTVPDASPNGYHGTNNGGRIQRGAGNVGNALSLNGNSFLHYHDDLSSDFGTAVSIAAWVRPNVSGEWRAIAALDDSTSGGNSPPALLRSTNRGEWEFFLDTSQGTTVSPRVKGGVVAVDTWSHVCGTYDGSTAKVYVDGSEVVSEPVSGTLDDPVDGLFVGAWQKQNGSMIHHWKGLLDEVRIYNWALRKRDISALATMGGNP